jgi:hypothetical protein
MVEALVVALMDRDELIGDEITDIMERAARENPARPAAKPAIPEAVVRS